MLRAVELGLSYEMLDHLPCGAVIDMCIEKMNDNETYPIKAEQGDIEAFFGKG